MLRRDDSVVIVALDLEVLARESEDDQKNLEEATVGGVGED